MAASTRLTGARTGLQRAALGTAAVFCLAGVLGFVPGVTANYGSLGLAGHGSGALLLGIFQVSALHNIVHLLFGVAGLLMARTHAQARSYLVYGGVIYLVLWLYGLLVGDTTPANFVPANNADNWLHLVLGLAMIALAVMLARGPATNASTNNGDNGSTSASTSASTRSEGAS
ncbi:DUF4383 domain-containing protein [Pseudarthrobacter phenanthrenivorans]|uniref:DUF4383 domain-containing protein n=1 Tax=Pseudarthrobacter phenanthrenivorans TaxID=361575 RepID=UPI00112AE4FC|nr:DUF4383 domain-containing protein [Pseudarthrobacter phenanthrenivorans]TPV50671.1 DUF4383 domain-containing protein [Pseudarthrobacter phenanthrenivorans]